ncbi:cytochrome c oxidase assembly protein [Metallibacterium sp.]|uniref:cytochrome c oxidase assembly protein n=1 Tax=Metallibacterium sp. TaxID=2940281 RepID=UPI00262D5CB2|nr:cytochrome c oxidase assembly protein [Metallibacterium sp.]
MLACPAGYEASARTMLDWLIPWEFSPTLLVVWLAAALLYALGARRRRVPRARQALFWCGMALVYFALLTHFDYYALHQFFVDRIQQVMMHHLAPRLIMLAYPLGVWRAALPLRWRARLLRPFARAWPWRAVAALLFNPLLATLLFVALVLVWLIPRVMTLAMLDWRLYLLMNWSMLLSGLIYWGLVLDHRRRPPARMAPGLRVLSPALSMTPQILVGAIITFSKTDLYPIFSICGRALDINVLTDQQYGGLITWVPAAIIEAIAALLALRTWMRLSQQRPRRATPRAALPAAP